MNSNYKRVSRKRTCLICGKPDWCSYTPDGKVSFCARISQGADRISRTGWGVFHHEQSLFGNSPIPFPSKPPTKKVELAPIEIRDFAFRKLIELSPASKFPQTVDGPKGLRNRRILNFDDFGGLPPTFRERQKLAKLIRSSVNLQFPEYVRKFQSSLSGIPGFWLDRYGKYQLWTENNYLFPFLVIPYRNAQGMIQACQLRAMTETQNEMRYFWLSTPRKSGGISCGSPLHFVRPMANFSTFSKPILVTEGALKSETLQIFYPDFNVVALGGIASSHFDFIKASRYFPLFTAFDNDYSQNPQVLRQLARFIKARLEDAKTHQYNPNLKLFSWSFNFKGVDDALLNNQNISELNFCQWLLRLNQSVRNEFIELMQ